MICPYNVKVPDKEIHLCMLYCRYSIDGKHWSHYPDCKKENCPFLHPELLGDLIWEDK